MILPPGADKSSAVCSRQCAHDNVLTTVTHTQLHSQSFLRHLVRIAASRAKRSGMKQPQRQRRRWANTLRGLVPSYCSTNSHRCIECTCQREPGPPLGRRAERAGLQMKLKGRRREEGKRKRKWLRRRPPAAADLTDAWTSRSVRKLSHAAHRWLLCLRLCVCACVITHLKRPRQTSDKTRKLGKRSLPVFYCDCGSKYKPQKHNITGFFETTTKKHLSIHSGQCKRHTLIFPPSAVGIFWG